MFTFDGSRAMKLIPSRSNVFGLIDFPLEEILFFIASESAWIAGDIGMAMLYRYGEYNQPRSALPAPRKVR